MTTASDLQLRVQPRRRYFAKIDGLEPILWQGAGEKAPTRYLKVSDHFDNGVADSYTAYPGTGTVEENTFGWASALHLTAPKTLAGGCDWGGGTLPPYAEIPISVPVRSNSVITIVTKLYNLTTDYTNNKIGILWTDTATPPLIGAVGAAFYIYKPGVYASYVNGVLGNTVWQPTPQDPMWLKMEWDVAAQRIYCYHARSPGYPTLPNPYIDFPVESSYVFAGSVSTATFSPTHVLLYAGQLVSGTCNAGFDSFYYYDAWPRSGFSCLKPPSKEYSWGLDLGEMKVEPSSMDFEVDNILDPVTNDGTYYFAKLFAPGRQAESGTLIAHLASSIGPDDTTITCKEALTGWPSSGTAYIGGETFSYDAISGNSFTGCVRGLYPCVGADTQTFAQSFFVPQNDENYAVRGTQISSKPYSWFGRRISLFCTTFNQQTGEWNPYADSVLVWVGRITNTIRYSSQMGTWQISGDSIIKDLDRKVCQSLEKKKLEGINLLGGNLDFMVNVRDDDGHKLSFTCTVNDSVYTNQDEVALAIDNAIRTANVTVSGGGFDSGKYPIIGIGKVVNTANGGEQFRFYVTNYLTIGLAGKDINVDLFLYDKSGNATKMNDAFRVLGFTQIKYNFNVDFEQTGEVLGEESCYISYHRCSKAANGGKLMLSSPAGEHDFFTINGDGPNDTTSVEGKFRFASGVIKKTYPDSTPYQFIYDSITSETYTPGFEPVQYSTATLQSLSVESTDLRWCGQKVDDSEDLMIEQVYWISPWKAKLNLLTGDFDTIGPFESLLYMLLSTGSENGYNESTYDQLPRQLSVGMQANLVDIDSFLDADKELASGDLTKRLKHIIYEPTPFIDIVRRECQLFGYCLCWDSSKQKISLKNVYRRSTISNIVEINDSNNALAEEFPDVDSSDKNVINVWEVECAYDHNQRKYLRKISLEDSDSISALGVTKAIKIQHPGIGVENDVAAVDELLKTTLLKQSDFTRYPWQVISRSLSPEMINRVNIGDVVKVVSSNIPDPYGTGSMSSTIYGLVINYTWNPESHTGNCTILLCSNYDATTKLPWSFHAAVDDTATNGGWDSANKQLTMYDTDYGLIGYPDDAASILQDDKLLIVERSPSNPLNPLKWQVTAAKNYEVDGANILTISEALGGWDAAKQYVVMPDTRANCSSNQKATNTFQASQSTFKFASGDKGNKYG